MIAKHMQDNLAFAAVVTDVRRKHPRWSQSRVEAEAKVIYHKRKSSNAS